MSKLHERFPHTDPSAPALAIAPKMRISCLFIDFFGHLCYIMSRSRTALRLSIRRWPRRQTCLMSGRESLRDHLSDGPIQRRSCNKM